MQPHYSNAHDHFARVATTKMGAAILSRDKGTNATWKKTNFTEILLKAPCCGCGPATDNGMCDPCDKIVQTWWHTNDTSKLEWSRPAEAHAHRRVAAVPASKRTNRAHQRRICPGILPATSTPRSSSCSIPCAKLHHNAYTLSERSHRLCEMFVSALETVPRRCRGPALRDFLGAVASPRKETDLRSSPQLPWTAKGA